MQNKRGFTLAELVIALLLLAILSVVIVTFSLTINANILSFTRVVETTDDMAYIKEMVVQWVSHFDADQYEIVCEPAQIVAVKKGDATEQYCLFMQKDENLPTDNDDSETLGYTLIAQYESWTATYQTKTAVRADFSQRTVSGNILIKCSIMYVESGKIGENEMYDYFVFAVGTRVQQGG